MNNGLKDHHWIGILAVALLLLCGMGLAYAAVQGQWRVNLLRGSTTIATEVGATQETAWANCQKRIAAMPAGASTYTCQTPRYVATVVAEPVPTPSPTPTPTPTPSPTPTPTPVPPTGTPAAVFDFENGSSGAKVAGAGLYPFATVYDNALAYSGKQSARMNVSRGAEGYGQWGLEYTWPKTIPRGGEAWMQFRIYFPSGFNFSASPWLKYLRFHVATSGGSNVGYDDIYIAGGSSSGVGSFVFISEPQDKRVDGPSSGITRGRWITFEYYVRFDTVAKANGGQARAILWQEGKLVFDVTTANTMKSTSDRSDKALIFTTWNGNAPATQSANLDDLVVFTSETGAPQGRDAAGNVCICSP